MAESRPRGAHGSCRSAWLAWAWGPGESTPRCVGYMPELPLVPELPELEEDPEELSLLPVTDWTVPTTAPAAPATAWVILSSMLEAVSWAVEAMSEALSMARRTTDLLLPARRVEAPREERARDAVDREAAAERAAPVVRPRALAVVFFADFVDREADFFFIVVARRAPAERAVDFLLDFFADFLADLAAISAPCDLT